jgi:hypothetical protein
MLETRGSQLGKRCERRLAIMTEGQAQSKPLATARAQQRGYPMFSKSALFATIAAVLALAVPAVASAEVTDSEGKTIPVGSELEGTSTNTVLSTALGKVACTSLTVFDKLTVNTESSSEAESTKEGTSKECFAGGKAITVTDLTMIHWQVFPAFNNGVAKITEKVDFPGGITCHFVGEVGFTYVTNSDTMTIAGGVLVGTPAACGKAELNGNYTWVWKGKPVKFK